MKMPGIIHALALAATSFVTAPAPAQADYYVWVGETKIENTPENIDRGLQVQNAAAQCGYRPLIKSNTLFKEIEPRGPEGALLHLVGPFTTRDMVLRARNEVEKCILTTMIVTLTEK